MNLETFRSLALSLPEAEEKSHFGKADFRVRNKIFVSLPDAETAVVKFTPEQQEMLVAAEPAIFAPVKGGWGRQGWTVRGPWLADRPGLPAVPDRPGYFSIVAFLT